MTTPDGRLRAFPPDLHPRPDPTATDPHAPWPHLQQWKGGTLESALGQDTHWSTRALAAKHGISHETVAQVWRAFGLKPWRADHFKVSPNLQLVEKIRDIVGLHMTPSPSCGTRARMRSSSDLAAYCSAINENHDATT